MIEDERLRSALLDEMRFFNMLMFDHVRFLRNGFDPTEDDLFNRANEFAQAFRPLVTVTETTSDWAPKAVVFGLMARSIDETRRIMRFKMEVVNLLRQSRLLAIIPADLVDHMVREAAFYLADLYNVTGGPEVSRNEIGIPDGMKRAFVVPRRLIYEFPEARFEIAINESLFWLKDNFEHADTLALFYRPRMQHELVEETLRFSGALKEVYEEAVQVNQSGAGLEEMMRHARGIMISWRQFLANLYEDLVNGRVPTGQINIWPWIVDHMRREADYYLEVLGIFLKSAAMKEGQSEPSKQHGPSEQHGPPGPP